MVAALTLLDLGDTSRDLYLYDTYEGMPPPSDKDWRRRDGARAGDLLASRRTTEDRVWAYAPLDAVREAVLGTGYPADRVHFVKGKVEDTVPGVLPDRVALLRLDTDWYDSTRHELEHLYPRVPAGGVLVLDDYGHWDGARRAVDEWLERDRPGILLHRLGQGRIGVVPSR